MNIPKQIWIVLITRTVVQTQLEPKILFLKVTMFEAISEGWNLYVKIGKIPRVGRSDVIYNHSEGTTSYTMPCSSVTVNMAVFI